MMATSTPTLPAALREDLAQRIGSRTGLVFEGLRGPAFDVAIERACAELSCSPRELLERIDAGHPIWTKLIEVLTVGESYFFRDPAHFAPFVEHLREHGRARVWSMGCATGEEPYSLAILALEQLGAAADEVEIWASDLNPGFLAQAVAGRYRAWSMRGVAPEVIDRYFDRDGNALVLHPRVRHRVTFFAANLLAPTSAWPTELDFIYCRNVLIYFSNDHIQQVLAALAACLTPGGRLVLGPTDPYPEGLPLTRSRQHGFTSWIAGPTAPSPEPSPCAPEPPSPRPAATTTASSDPPPVATPASSSESRPVTTRRRTPHSPVAASPSPPRRSERPTPPPSTPPPRDASEEPSELCERARTLADRGDMDQALAVVAQALALDPFGATPYLVRAQIQQHRGHHAGAMRDARRALLLDASLGYAHVVRAISQIALGRHPAARCSLRSARRLLQSLPEHAPVPGSGQLSRSEVMDICASLDAIVDERMT